MLFMYLMTSIILVTHSCKMPSNVQVPSHKHATWAGLCGRAWAGQGPRVFCFDQVVSEDAGQEFTYNYTAHKLVKRVRREGGAGCFITLGVPRSGKTYTMEASMCMHLLPAASAGSQECQCIICLHTRHAQAVQHRSLAAVRSAVLLCCSLQCCC